MHNYAYIMNIGSELSSGLVVNDNGSYLASKLDLIGISTIAIKSVPDDPIEIANSIEEAVEKAKWVILTGGLGPTSDDLTREAVAAALGISLEYHDEIAAFLYEKFEKPTEGQLRQAYLPEGAAYLAPEYGTAPGFRLEYKNSVIYVLPGVPEEMKEMAESAVISEISEETGEPQLLKVLYSFCEIPEVEIEKQIKGIIEKLEGFSLLPKGLQVDLRISVEKESFEEIDAEIKDKFGNSLFGMQGETLQEGLGWLLKNTGKTISFAESCTGGLVSEMLTQIPGSSDYFIGSAITYSNESKIKLLEVNKETIEKHGAVSEECAIEMAEGALRVFGSDISASITGIAGPSGGSKEKPVGLVYIGIANKHNDDIKLAIRKYMFRGNRENIRIGAAQGALNMLRLKTLEA